MNLGHVSVVSIIGMIISMLIAIGLPVFLMLFVRKKEKAQILKGEVGQTKGNSHSRTD